MFRDSRWEITQPNLNLGTFYDTELNSEGEGPSRGLLRDYESSDGPSFQVSSSNIHTYPPHGHGVKPGTSGHRIKLMANLPL